jgi:hypothetical protein
MERPELPLDYYSDLVDLSYSAQAEIASGDGGKWEVQQEEFIAECMKGEGFSYYPRKTKQAESDAEEVSVGDRRLWLAWLPEDLAEVERYGYGHTDPDASSSVLQQEPTDAEMDPNSEYLASLSASGQSQYRVALMGAELAAYNVEAGLETVPLPELGGCMGAAEQKYPYPYVETLAESPATLHEDLINQMRDQAGSPYSAAFVGRARLDSLDAEWWGCFEQVFPGARPVMDETTPIEDLGTHAGPSFARDWAFYTGPEGDPWEGDVRQAPAEYSSLTGTPREIAIAVADFKCRQETDYVDRFLAIEREAQEEFIATHKTQLDEMAAALEAYING